MKCTALEGRVGLPRVTAVAGSVVDECILPLPYRCQFVRERESDDLEEVVHIESPKAKG